LRPLAASPSSSALFIDFDGTLSGIVDDPVGATALPGVPALLAGLAAHFALVAVISGRPTAFLLDRLASPAGVELVGLYGLERALGGPGGEAARWAEAVDEVVAEAEASAPPGVHVEPKGLTVTLHWRHAPAEEPWVETFAARQSSVRGFRAHPGRMSLELQPPLAVDKGTVVRALAQDTALEAAAAFGDDLGDLPAFAALGELRTPAGRPAYTVRVAVVDAESPAAVAEAADLTVAAATGAVALLGLLRDAAAAQA
jgi:trehalose 6-phosphate phosphatase